MDRSNSIPCLFRRLVMAAKFHSIIRHSLICIMSIWHVVKHNFAIVTDHRGHRSESPVQIWGDHHIEVKIETAQNSSEASNMEKSKSHPAPTVR